MLKFENTAEVGDMIRALDFEPIPDRPDSYVTGRVVEKGAIYVEIDGVERYLCHGYSIVCQYCTNGKRVGMTIYVPFESGFTDFDTRVENLTRHIEVA